jgi:hypothetical protein
MATKERNAQEADLIPKLRLGFGDWIGLAGAALKS